MYVAFSRSPVTLSHVTLFVMISCSQWVEKTPFHKTLPPINIPIKGVCSSTRSLDLVAVMVKEEVSPCSVFPIQSPQEFLPTSSPSWPSRTWIWRRRRWWTPWSRLTWDHIMFERHIVQADFLGMREVVEECAEWVALKSDCQHSRFPRFIAERVCEENALGLWQLAQV